eukprot:16367-Heterococcus_DN1.PRE.1
MALTRMQHTQCQMTAVHKARAAIYVHACSVWFARAASEQALPHGSQANIRCTLYRIHPTRTPKRLDASGQPSRDICTDYFMLSMQESDQIYTS